jgi:integrase
VINKLLVYRQLLKTFGVQCTYLMLLQSLYGFRIGELLALKRHNLSHEGFLYVPGMKKSSSRIVRIPEMLEENYFATLMPDDNMFTITYNQYYRFVSKLNLSRLIPAGKHNRKVTHAFRYLRIQSNEQLAGDDLSAVQNFSGHKSKRGLSFYLKDHRLDSQNCFVHK